jgi:hypothetical protein
MSARLGLLFTLIVILGLTTSCATEKPGVYRGGQLVQEGPLDIQDRYSFRFVDKWRISHAWLSGPVDIRPCGYGIGNPFSNRPGFERLGGELNAPMFERDGQLFDVGSHYKTNELLVSPVDREKIYGTNRDGKFEGYSPFCGQVFAKDSRDGLGLYLVKPDSAKGTDEWIEGAQPVTINGLQWLHKEIPIRDWSESRERSYAPIEYWVLKIPDTQYWMLLRFSASTGSGSKFGLGANFHPEKHKRLLDLFHRIVESVKLEPITPINIDHLLN